MSFSSTDIIKDFEGESLKYKGVDYTFSYFTLTDISKIRLIILNDDGEVCGLEYDESEVRYPGVYVGGVIKDIKKAIDDYRQQELGYIKYTIREKLRVSEEDN